MSVVEARGNKATRHEFCSDRHTVSLLTDHSAFSPADKEKMLPGEVAEAAEEIVSENNKELDIEVIIIDDEKEKALENGYITPYTISLPALRLCIVNTEDVTQREAIMPVGYGVFFKKAGRR